MNAGRRRIKYADTIERRSLEFVIPLNGRWTVTVKIALGERVYD
jgi:hypothetical protein